MLPVNNDGWITHSKVRQEHRPAIEHSPIAQVSAVVLHRTATANAQSVLNAWNTRKSGTHFLIAEDGSIYQSASLKKQCWHVGQLYSRCRKTSSCSQEDAAVIEQLLHRKNASWGEKFRLVTRHELGKGYPERFPHNHDSLGIEIVGVMSAENKIYELPSAEQQKSLFWLVDELIRSYSLSLTDIYAHGDIAHKEPSEGKASLDAYLVERAG